MHAGRIRDTGRVLKTVTVDVSKEPVNLLSRRRGGEFTIESREPSAFPQPDNLHHTSSFLDLLMRNLVTMSGGRERERRGEKRTKYGGIDALVIAILFSLLAFFFFFSTRRRSRR